jgi:hypothetical protein
MVWVEDRKLELTPWFDFKRVADDTSALVVLMATPDVIRPDIDLPIILERIKVSKGKKVDLDLVLLQQ